MLSGSPARGFCPLASVTESSIALPPLLSNWEPILSSQNPLVRKLDHIFPLTSEEKALLDSVCTRTLDFEANEHLVLDGDRPTDCNLLLHGMTCRNHVTAGGKRQIFSFHIPGDIFDAQSFLLQKMDHTVTALTACTVALIPHSKMVEITERYPRIARAIWKDTLVDAAVFREWIMNVGQRNAHQRLAHLMCELYVRHDVMGLAEGLSIPWPITQQDFGDATGLSSVHVNRTLMDIRGKGLITLTKSRLTIHDWEGLVKEGEFDPDYLHLKTNGAATPLSRSRSGQRGST
jgi:CRP-like cAMP-binding protein